MPPFQSLRFALGVVILGSCSFHQRAVVRNFRWVCVMLNAAGYYNRCSSLEVSEPTDFWTFVGYFIVAFGSNQLQKKLWRGRLLIGWEKKKKEKDLLNWKYKVTFQPDGCVEPTCTAMCFIHFGFSHHLDNIRLLKCPFVMFYLFVY